MDNNFTLHGLTIEVGDQFNKEDAKQAIERAFRTIDLKDDSKVYLIKVIVSDNTRADKMVKVLSGLRTQIAALGLSNCMFVPIQKDTIKDISIDSISISRAGHPTVTRGIHLGHKHYCSGCGKLSYMENYCSQCGGEVVDHEKAT